MKDLTLGPHPATSLALGRHRLWDIITFEPGDAIEFASVELQISIADIYFEAGVACSG